MRLDQGFALVVCRTDILVRLGGGILWRSTFVRDRFGTEQLLTNGPASQIRDALGNTSIPYYAVPWVSK